MVTTPAADAKRADERTVPAAVQASDEACPILGQFHENGFTAVGGDRVREASVAVLDDLHDRGPVQVEVRGDRDSVGVDGPRRRERRDRIGRAMTEPSPTSCNDVTSPEIEKA
jgi:hypothetical protein